MFVRSVGWSSGCPLISLHGDVVGHAVRCFSVYCVVYSSCGCCVDGGFVALGAWAVVGAFWVCGLVQLVGAFVVK